MNKDLKNQTISVLIIECVILAVFRFSAVFGRFFIFHVVTKSNDLDLITQSEICVTSNLHK